MGRIKIKKYKVIDCQNCNFMDDTHIEPMTMNSLRARFWGLDDCKSTHYRQFTKEYISEMWDVKFEEVTA